MSLNLIAVTLAVATASGSIDIKKSDTTFPEKIFGKWSPSETPQAILGECLSFPKQTYLDLLSVTCTPLKKVHWPWTSLTGPTAASPRSGTLTPGTCGGPFWTGRYLESISVQYVVVLSVVDPFGRAGIPREGRPDAVLLW
jgi:hypothetical protein